MNFCFLVSERLADPWELTQTWPAMPRSGPVEMFCRIDSNMQLYCNRNPPLPLCFWLSFWQVQNRPELQYTWFHAEVEGANSQSFQVSRCFLPPNFEGELPNSLASTCRPSSNWSYESLADFPEKKMKERFCWLTSISTNMSELSPNNQCIQIYL